MARVPFRNVNVLDCTGAAPFVGQVLVEGNRIKAVTPQGTEVGPEIEPVSELENAQSRIGRSGR